MQKILKDFKRLKKTTKDFKGLGKTAKDFKGLQKNDKHCQRYLSKLFRTIRQLYFFKNWAIQTISSKPENNNTTIRQYKKRYVEGCACAGAALKIGETGIKN